MLTNDQRKIEESFLRDRYMNECRAEDSERFIQQLCQFRVIRARKSWAVGRDGIKQKATVVRAWEIVNVIDGDVPMRFLYSDEVISDYKGRFTTGDYIFTSQIIDLNEEAGLVQTGNSIYCLAGDGEELNATLREAYNMRSLGQSLHLLRNVEGQLGPNSAFRDS